MEIDKLHIHIMIIERLNRMAVCSSPSCGVDIWVILKLMTVYSSPTCVDIWLNMKWRASN